jgi:hypothetical protein
VRTRANAEPCHSCHGVRCADAPRRRPPSRSRRLIAPAFGRRSALSTERPPRARIVSGEARGTLLASRLAGFAGGVHPASVVFSIADASRRESKPPFRLEAIHTACQDTPLIQSARVTHGRAPRPSLCSN